jgi:parallel beta helix pectate lyase-like protein
MRRQGYSLRARLGINGTRGLLGLALLVAGLALGCGDAEPQTASQPAPRLGGVGRSPQASCDLYAATWGSDSAPGSRRRPFRTAGELVHALHRGQTGCLRRGTYTFSLLKVETPDIILSAYRNQGVTLEGEVKVLPSAAGASIQGMKLDGGGGSGHIGPRIYADGVVLRDNEITNDHTAICVSVSAYYSNPPPHGVVIERNRIHDCGTLPPTNHEHGIYVAHGVGTVIRDNWIYDNADRGIQLYPDAQRTKVVANVIDSNGQGIVLSGAGSEVSSNNLIAHNIISNSNVGWNVYSGAPGPTAKGNVLRHNCLWAGNSRPLFDTNGGLETPSRNFLATANSVVHPQYSNPAAADYTLSPKSACPLARRLDSPPSGGRS